MPARISSEGANGGRPSNGHGVGGGSSSSSAPAGGSGKGDSKAIGARLVNLGGGKLVKELMNLDKMRSGEAAKAKGNLGNLNAKNLIPFIGPSYKSRYRTA